MICSIGDKKIRVGLMLAGVKKHYVSLVDIKDEEIIITSQSFFDNNKSDFEELENTGKIVIKFMDKFFENNSGGI